MLRKPVTMSEVARRAGVSKNTVSLALRRSPLVIGPTRRRIVRIAERLGYQKNPTVAHLMAQLRSSRTPRFKATLAILNANIDPDAFRRHPTVPTYLAGCRRRADELGYSLDEFWLHDPALNARSLIRTFKNRNIRGAVILGLMDGNRLPVRFAPLWKLFPAVVTGVRTENPTLSFTAVDQYTLSLTAFRQALQMGYRRPALVLDHVIDELVDGRFTAGVAVAQQKIPAEQRTRPFYLVNEARATPRLFQRWLKAENPDLILTLYHVVKKWLTDLGYRIPRDLGLIQLERRLDHADWAGMDQHNDIVGEAAVEMLIGLIHSGAQGIPAFPQSTLIGSSWINGKTVRMRSRSEAKEHAGEIPGFACGRLPQALESAQ